MIEKPMLAIDPGVSGGLAFYDGNKVWVEPMPETHGDLLDLLLEFNEPQMPAIPCYLEQLVKFTGSGASASSTATYAANWGIILGMLMALQYRIVLTTPGKWQKALSLGNSRGWIKSQWKSKLRGEAERLFPGIKVTLKTADALLILEAARKGLL